MGSSASLEDAGESLEVGKKDVADLKRTASRQRLLHAFKLGLPVLSFFLGLWMGRTVVPPSSVNNAYPFLGAAGIQTLPRTSRQVSWAATIILSGVLYIFGLLLYKLMVQDSFGVVTLYGTHSRHFAH